MRNGRFHPPKCRGKVQKMGVLYAHLPKMQTHIQTSSKYKNDKFKMK